MSWLRDPRGTIVVALVLGLGGAAPGVVVAADPPRPAEDSAPKFNSWWQDGKAELDGYRWTGTRYGEPRRGNAVMIFVTEPWSESKRVKVDDPSRNPGDVFEALKLNFIRDFQTGIYDYNTMVSTFVRSADFSPVKVSFSSAEWCGHVYDELRFDPGAIAEERRSYFEDESGSRRLERPRDGVIEDNLFIFLRGLRGDAAKPGEKRTVPFLPSVFLSRLTHRPLAWTTAEIERLSRNERVTVPAGEFEAMSYLVRVPGREGRFEIEAAYPHRVLRWSWRPAGSEPARPEGLDEGKLVGTERVAYWTLNHNGGESALKVLGLSPVRP